MTQKPWYLTFAAVAAFGLIFVSTANAQVVPTPETEPEAASPTPDVNEQIPEVTEAIEKFNNRDIQGALDALRRARKSRPELPPAEVILAQFCARANLASGVRLWLERAVMEEPGDPQAYLILGDVAIRNRQVTEASLLFQKAQQMIATMPAGKRKDALAPQVLAGMAAVAEARGQWDQVKTYLSDLLKLAPENVVALQRMARTLFQLKDPKGALAELKKAKDLNENVLSPSTQLAMLYDQAGDRDQAKQWMEYSLKSEPNDLRVQLIGAQWMLNNGDLAQAQTLSSKALQIDPQSLQAKVLRGVVALYQNKYTEAERYFEEAHLQSPSSFAPSNNLALALCEQSDEAKKMKALEYATSNARQYRQGQFAPEAASTYGWVLYKLGRVDDASRVLTSLIQQTGGNVSPDTAYYLAQVLVEKGQKDQAKKILEGILKGDRQFSKKIEAKRLLDTL